LRVLGNRRPRHRGAVIAPMATQSTETIADVQRTFNALTGRTLAYKPFHKKLAKPTVAEFIRMLVGHLLDGMRFTDPCS